MNSSECDRELPSDQTLGRFMPKAPKLPVFEAPKLPVFDDRHNGMDCFLLILKAMQELKIYMKKMGLLT